MKDFSLDSISSQKGKIALVTGANIGLGYETALALARKKATVILACRTLTKAQQAKKDILKEVPEADLEIILLDLNSLDSVREFAVVFSKRYERLDLLIANAGIMMPPFQKTEDGFESQFGVNYFAHFLLVNLLFPALKNTNNSRVVMLSSIAHKGGKIEFDNLNSEKTYSSWKAYSQSKLACLMFAYELQRRIEKAKINSKALAAHPGFSNTNLGQLLPTFAAKLFSPLASFIGQNAKSGALPTLRAALDPEAKGGTYYGPNGFREVKGKPVIVGSSKKSHNQEVAAQLWEISEKLTGDKFVI
ncbi:NAD(P)-dependent dehydrogenase (short-subunit alcohol dehydrogenase family) [Algoriphagus ratkowskyi]|uniref:NAD(P)-dependent dehydrogenase (Short-subunit alcohol dehydrogenase family) n=1 Tax=Algoriphagus ratkowskyi TaxID=57028 RepID=A0A2W7RN34_9BACT|nr:oxidoreductase [Algoriphagus ratkowskyi]PZX56927.1 NAD(P)-dependent dehydrogenase (short-subunit alcohol dehydrogenase family) [Algoriphagus ratkowskyi]TXD79839.1 SDR family NAD(P)-dependent oxidoreductase [Algoriphagus ratkowskyi]